MVSPLRLQAPSPIPTGLGTSPRVSYPKPEIACDLVRARIGKFPSERAGKRKPLRRESCRILRSCPEPQRWIARRPADRCLENAGEKGLACLYRYRLGAYSDSVRWRIQ